MKLEYSTILYITTINLWGINIFMKFLFLKVIRMISPRAG